MQRFSAASKQVLLLPLLRNFTPEKNTSDAYNMVFLTLLINWGGGVLVKQNNFAVIPTPTEYGRYAIGEEGFF